MENVFANCAVVRLPFADPDNEEALALKQMLERIAALDAHAVSEAAAAGQPGSSVGSIRGTMVASSPMERHPRHLVNILKRCNFHLEGAMQEWSEWHHWRTVNKNNDITAESVQPLMRAGLAEWRGRDKEGRRCLVVTGRMLVEGVARVPLQFKQFMIFLAERCMESASPSAPSSSSAGAGKRGAEETKAGMGEEGEASKNNSSSNSNSNSSSSSSSKDQIVVVYDRRGLLFENIDIGLYRDCRIVLDDIRRFYGEFLHCFYALHMTWPHWIVYYTVLKPLLGISGQGKKFVVEEHRTGLLKYFDVAELNKMLLPFYDGPGSLDPLTNETGTTAAATQSTADSSSSRFGELTLGSLGARLGLVEREAESTTLPESIER